MHQFLQPPRHSKSSGLSWPHASSLLSWRRNGSSFYQRCSKIRFLLCELGAMIWGGEYEVWLTCWMTAVTAVTGTVWTSCPVNSWGESGGGGGGGTCISAAPEYNIWMKHTGCRWFLSCGINRSKTKEGRRGWLRNTSSSLVLFSKGKHNCRKPHTSVRAQLMCSDS